MNTSMLSELIAAVPGSHISMNTHTPLTTIENTMQILHHHRKGSHLNTIERYYIHAEHAANNHLNDDHTISPNNTLLKTYRP